MCLADLDFKHQRLTVRRSKGLQDRTVYLSASVCRALQAYLVVRGPAPTDHVLTYRNLALKKDLVRSRIKAAGKRVGVKVYPHRLRHTCATQLLNAGCRVTSIQRLLGHRRLNSTMVYARVHDDVVAEDYFKAMTNIEKGLDLTTGENRATRPVDEGEHVKLLMLANQLAVPELEAIKRLALVIEMYSVLNTR